MPEHLSTRRRRDTDGTLHTGTNQDFSLSLYVSSCMFSNFLPSARRPGRICIVLSRDDFSKCILSLAQRKFILLLLFHCCSSVSVVFRKKGCAEALSRVTVSYIDRDDILGFSDIDSEHV